MSNNVFDFLEYCTRIVTAYVSQNHLAPADLLKLLQDVYTVLVDINVEKDEPIEVVAEPLKPAVPVKKSIGPDYIICLEDGKKMKVLAPYIRRKFNLTPQEYRERWRLPSTYPMCAPSFSNARRQNALKIGLGTMQNKIGFNQ